MADAVKAFGQYVHQEAPDELGNVECHGRMPSTAVDAVVLDAECHAGGVGLQETAVRDRDAMRVARQIGEHLLGSGKRLFRVDEPTLLTQGAEELRERAAVASDACVPKNVSLPSACAVASFSSIKRRNSRESTSTGRKKLGFACPKKHLDDPDIDILLEEMRGERVSQPVGVQRVRHSEQAAPPRGRCG